LGIDSQTGNVGGFGFARSGMTTVGLSFPSSTPLRNDGTGSFATAEGSGALGLDGVLSEFGLVAGTWSNSETEIEGTFGLNRVAGTDQDFLRFGIWFGALPSPSPEHYGLISVQLSHADEVTALAVNAAGDSIPLTGLISGNELQLFGPGGLVFSGTLTRGGMESTGAAPGFVGSWSSPAIGVAGAEAVGTGCRLF